MRIGSAVMEKGKTMLRLTFELQTDSAELVKEHLSMYLERWGDIRLVKVEEIKPEQMTIEERGRK